MRHCKTGRKLNRDVSHRKALIRNLVLSLLRYERIETTLPKAKEMRRTAEKTITIAKKKSSNAHRRIFQIIQNKEITKKLLDNLADRFATRNGGYTRIIRIGTRPGDCASMAVIELVDRDQHVDEEAKIKKEKRKKEKEEKKKKELEEG